MPKRYSKPPVIEAVIDAVFGSGFSKAELDRIARRLEGQFPVRKDEMKVGVEISPTGVRLQQNQTGFRLTSDDALKLVLLMPSNVTSSMLAPYEGWNSLRAQTEKIWTGVRRITDRRPIQRLGVRFINRLDIPHTEIDLAEWINLQVALPQKLGTVFQAFSGSAVIPVEQLTAIIRFESTPSPMINHSSLMLDIDVFADHNIPLSDVDLWELLERMRTQKNDIFEACVTPKMKQFFV